VGSGQWTEKRKKGSRQWAGKRGNGERGKIEKKWAVGREEEEGE
jgi:hypothetical protein